MSDIQRADPKDRGRFVIFVLAVLVILVPTLIWLNSYTESIEVWLAQPGKIIERAKLTIIVITVIGVVLLLLLAIFTFRFAGAILRYDRYPPENIKVIRDVRICRGVAAHRIGRLMQAYGIVVLLSLVATIVAAWFLILNVDRMAS